MVPIEVVRTQIQQVDKCRDIVVPRVEEQIKVI